MCIARDRSCKVRTGPTRLAFINFPSFSPVTSPLGMLPTPASSRSPRPKIYFPSLPSHKPSQTSLLVQLRQRTKLTNLAVLLLGFVLILSLTQNVAYFFSSSTPAHFSGWIKAQSQGWAELATAEQLAEGVPLSIETTIERDPRYPALDHMIMVPGHAIWTGNDPNLVEEDDQWILEPMQRGGSVKTFVKHIRQAVSLLESDTNALLVFSG